MEYYFTNTKYLEPETFMANICCFFFLDLDAVKACELNPFTDEPQSVGGEAAHSVSLDEEQSMHFLEFDMCLMIVL